MRISPLAGHPPPETMLLDVAKLVTAYYAEIPDPAVPAQRVAFGTSGHRGSSFERTFNEWHVLAISEAICRYRRQQGIGGPLFLGFRSEEHTSELQSHGLSSYAVCCLKKKTCETSRPISKDRKKTSVKSRHRHSR